MIKDKLTVAGKKFKSRLIVGTGKYKNFKETAEAIKASGADMVTVAVRRVNILDKKKPVLMDYLDPKKIIYTPNGVSFQEIEKVSKTGVQINIDNLSLLEQFGSKYPNTPVCVRINPHVMAGGNSNISVGHIDSKFGISIHQIPHLKRIVENTNMHINGIHMHTGSDILDICLLYTSPSPRDRQKSRMPSSA